MNWCNAYRKAEVESGNGFIGLIPRTKDRGCRKSRLPVGCLDAVNEFIDREVETVVNQTKRVSYGKLQKYCEEKGLIVPSEKTFKNLLKQRPKEQFVKKTIGGRAEDGIAQFYWELEMTTPRHGERPFEIGHIDHTQVDLELEHSETGKKLGKPWLTLLVDAYARRVLAFYLTFDPPSNKSNMMVLRECVRRFNRLPQIIVTDHGRDFKSGYFKSLLALYKVTHKLRPPRKARFGSLCERLFGTANTQLFHNLRGNSKIMKNVRMVTKSVNPKNHTVWNLPFLYELSREYFYEFYDTSDHSALGESPRDCFKRGITLSGTRPIRFIPYNEEFLIMTLPAIKTGDAKVDSQRGVKVRYLYYHCEEFTYPDVANSRVGVKYDPWDSGIVYAYVRNKWVKCYSQFYSVFKGRSVSEILIASEELTKRNSNHGAKSEILAEELGEFILKAEATEKMLQQRSHDSELQPVLTVINGGVDKLDEAKEQENECYQEDEELEDLNFDID